MEKQHTINGVQGRYWVIKNEGVRAPHCHDAQKWISEARRVKGYGEPAFLRVEIRHDDQCKNGHNSFAITGDIRGATGRDIAGGCLHDDIARVFPELAHLIKWHLSSTDGPMHYIANTCYLAGDLDHNGLRKGEKRQIKNGRTGALCWELVAEVNGEEVPVYKLEKQTEGDTPPEAPALRYVPWCKVGEGKERQLDAARRAAVWLDATDEQLSAPRAELAAMLEARLPSLLDEMKRDIEAIGFQFSATNNEVTA